MKNRNNDPDMKLKIGKRLRELRKGKMNQQELADRIHISREMISNFERGESTLSYDHARNIGKVLGARPEYILCEDDYPTLSEYLSSTFSGSADFRVLASEAKEQKDTIFYIQSAITVLRTNIDISPVYGSFDEIEDGIISTLDQVFPRCDAKSQAHVIGVLVNKQKLSNTQFYDLIFTSMNIIESTIRPTVELILKRVL